MTKLFFLGCDKIFAFMLNIKHALRNEILHFQTHFCFRRIFFSSILFDLEISSNIHASEKTNFLQCMIIDIKYQHYYYAVASPCFFCLLIPNFYHFIHNLFVDNICIHNASSMTGFRLIGNFYGSSWMNYLRLHSHCLSVLQE